MANSDLPNVHFNVKNLTNKTFNYLTVISFQGFTKHRQARWLVQCKCGSKPFIVISDSLISGNTKSCGCLVSESNSRACCSVCGKPTVEHYRDRVMHIACVGLYMSYRSMLLRCCYPKFKHYKYYGGRGIKICYRWHKNNPNGQKNFYKDALLAGWYLGTELHRKNNDGRYSPNNTIWVTRSQHSKLHVHRQKHRFNKEGVFMSSKDYAYSHGTYVKLDNGQDALVANVKNIHTNESKLEIIRNASVPFWVTKKPMQNHVYKKECVPDSELDTFRCKFAELPTAVAKALGEREFGYINYRNLLNSPYVYGADIELEVLVKMAAAKACSGVPTQYNIGILDIENSMLGNHEITNMSYVDGLTRNCYMAAYEPFLKGKTEADIRALTDIRLKEFREKLNAEAQIIFDKKPYTYEVYITDNELDLIKWTFKQINKHKPDFVGIWNIDHDIPYILERIEFRQGDAAEIMCHPDVPKELRYVHYKKDGGKGGQMGHFTDSWNWLDCTGFTQYICLQNLYSRLRKVQGREISYALGYVAGKTIGTGKLEFGDHKGHVVMQSKFFLDYTVYNLFDSIIPGIMEEINNDITNFMTLIGINRLKDFSHQTVLLKNKFYSYCRENGRVPCSVGSTMITEYDDLISNVGGAVLSPTLVRGVGTPLLRESDIETGVTIYDADIDYSALYPSICQAMNISKATKIATVLSIEGFLLKEDIFDYFAQIAVPNDNAIYICNKYYGLPSYQEMFERIMKQPVS